MLLNLFGLIVVNLIFFFIFTDFLALEQHHQWIKLTLFVKCVTRGVQNRLVKLILSWLRSLINVVHHFSIVTASNQKFMHLSQFCVFL